MYPKELLNNQKVDIIMKAKNKTTVGDLMRFSKKNSLNKKVKSNTKKIMRETDKELWEKNQEV